MIAENSAFLNGGGLDVDTVVLDRTTVRDNRAGGNGGGIDAHERLTISKCRSTATRHPLTAAASRAATLMPASMRNFGPMAAG